MFAIRQASMADLPGIYGIFRDAVRSPDAIWIDDPGTPEDRCAWLLLKEAQGFPVFVAVEDGEVLAYAALGEPCFRDANCALAEASLCVAPHARRRGIGRALLATLEEAAGAIGRDSLVASVDAMNRGSIALHRRCGFRQTRRMPGVGRKFGRARDLVLLRKEL